MKHVFTLSQFDHLNEAFIDASSLIYAQQADFLHLLQQSLCLYTLPAILKEARIAATGFHVVQQTDLTDLSPDQQLLSSALTCARPLISEDRKILMRARRAHLPHYNGLMMINFLLYRRLMSSEAYNRYYTALQRIARYSQPVWDYGESVHRLIIRSRDIHNDTNKDYSTF
ncbi:hypothetical protein CSA56_14560 [candidate division KSB3 bacterium]|uniref:Uncharacterized protein n=1 Tax=candidate division KSB3 bacterium TaxID=2044937 RepID=A0A2G6KAL3_9BACT|nr:MAG: hypothetical protein CSA56_14560 [candidate division KSB3 bacterium]